MSNNCSFNVNPLVKDFATECGTDKDKFLKYFSRVFKTNPYEDELEFRPEFTKWYYNKYKKSIGKAKNLTSEKIKEVINEYNSDNKPNYKDTEIEVKNSNSEAFGYSSSLARKKGIDYITRLIYKSYMNTEKDSSKPNYNLLSKIAGEKIAYIRDSIADMIAKDNDDLYYEIVENLTENCGEYIDKLIKENETSKEEKFSTKLLNWLALYRELSSTYKADKNSKSAQDKIIEEITNSELMTSLKLNKYDNLEEVDKATKVALESTEKPNDNDTTEADKENDAPDNTIRDHSLHHGELDDFMKHVDDRIKRVINTIPKLNEPVKESESSDEKVELNVKIDDNIGFPEYLDSTEICNILYSYTVKDDADSMVLSIRTIAESFPEYSGLSILSNLLKHNVDLKNSFFTTFGKHVISKSQSVLNDGVITYRISNKNANRLDTLKAQYINDFMITSVNANLTDAKEAFEELKNGPKDRRDTRKNKTNEIYIISMLKNNIDDNEIVMQVIGDLYKSLKTFYPSITPVSIVNFVKNNPDYKNPVEAATALYDDIKKAIDKSIEVQTAISRKQQNISDAIAYNKALKLKIKRKEKTNETFKDIDALIKEDPVTADMLTSPVSFAEHMLKYSLIKTNNNSINVHGNQSSDVLNSSLITRLKAIFENPERGENSPLQVLAEDYHLDTTTQFRLSNILIEQDGHAGIFRKDENGKYVPTEYANDILQFTLFNGAINQDTDTAVLYSEMSKGDYIGTSWANFFASEDNKIKGTTYRLGRYFLRIPSDAPKTFIAKAPRYLIDSQNPLFITGNQEEFDSFVEDITNKVMSLNKEVDGDILAEATKDTGVLIENDEDFIKHLLSKGEKRDGINLRKFVDDEARLKRIEFTKPVSTIIDEKGNQIQTKQVIFVKLNSDNTATYYVMEGQLKNDYLHNAKIVALFNANNAKNSIHNTLYNYFNSDFINKGNVSYDGVTVTRHRLINKNHQIFKQLKNAFKQELLDGIDAARLMFKTKEVTVGDRTGYTIVRDENLNPVMKEDWATDLNGLSPVYHFNKGKVYDKGKLTGRVFESDRFIIFDEHDNVVRNYGQELIDTVVRYLDDKNDDSRDNFLLWSESDGIFDLNLTTKQDNAIEEAISNYINDFIDNSYGRIKPMKDFMKGEKVTIDSVADYMLNHQLMYISSNELLEGDTKYYKDVQTFLKRTKEYQASGNPYGIASIRRTLTSSPIEKIVVGDASWGITMTDRFNAITFHTTKTFDKKILDNLENVLSNKKIMGDKVMSKDDAHILMYGLDGDGGYADAKVNDAQSYITFDEWVRRVYARGELDKYTPLINKILNNETLSANDLTEFIQVQKNIYYDLYYNSKTNRVCPRQIKNAEFVLVPQFIKGTELEVIYNFMKDNGIDQINTDETSKASNNYIVDIFDKEGRLIPELLTHNSLNEINAKETKNDEDISRLKKYNKYIELINKAKQPYSYNYLYEQQKVPQHIFAENKLAIQIAKKIIDNINPGHPLYSLKEKYFNIMTENIKDSFIGLMKEFNVPVDENGNLKAVDDTIFEKIDYKKFYDKLKTELGRLGIDENSLDYATLKLNPIVPGETIMPNYVGIMINKLESIVQSIITKNVTRQTLHGFHAAQITNIGYNNLATKKTIATDDRLQYHPAVTDKTGKIITEAYAEVKLPYSAFGIDKNSEHYKNMTDEEIIKELETKDLDKFIGYRIPTEGKQSVSVMKITGFISDGSGSTIVVPNEWVPQTGSDFDVDSVYGIMHKVKIDKRTGEIKKINYKDSFDRYDWYNYIAKKIGGRIEGMSDEEFKDIKENAKLAGKKATATYRAKLQELEQEAYNKLPGKYFKNKNDEEIYEGPKGNIVKIHKEIQKVYGNNHSRQRYIDQLSNELELLNNYLNRDNFDEEELKNIDTYTGIIQTIYNNLTGESTKDKELYENTKNETLKKAIDSIKEGQYIAYKELAESNGFMSEQEYLDKANANVEEYNSKTARDNKIVDIMLEIMEHPYSLEENLSRSNFDNITGNKNAAVDKLRNKVEQLKRKNRSPFNILDEAEFQEDAMQGFALKGFSVARDTFCSICNTVRPTISNLYSPVIAYDYSNLSDSEFNKKLEELHYSFDDIEQKEGEKPRTLQENVYNKGKIIYIKHNKIGWSNNDKNINGKYITVYSSQTTAHILDAMKSGPVPNVNKYTFGVYKTLVDIGSRYETAVGFIMHPAISVINKYYDRTNSIYANDVSTKYIESALEEYCDKLASIEDSGIKFEKKFTLNDKLKVINSKFGINISTDYMANKLLAINESELALRITNEEAFKTHIGGEVNMILSDMSHILHFAKLMELTNNISSIQQVTNPDKFGAKQSIFETERVFKNIGNYIKSQYSYDDSAKKYINHSILSVDGKDMLEAIYPDFIKDMNKVDDTFDSDIENFVKSKTNVTTSKYKTLCAHLKYGSATSIIVNKAFFITQTPSFRMFINQLETRFSDNKQLDEKTYKDFRNYIINSLYRQTSFINSTLAYNNRKHCLVFNEDNSRSSNNAEYTRIFGYNRSAAFELPVYDDELKKYINKKIKIINLSKPTQREIDMFAAMSPAQKVEFMKRNFEGESIFNYLNTRLVTTYKTQNTNPGAQLINFTESTVDIDYLRNLLYKAYTNKNPLIALAAADIIKYAFVVDGYSFTRNGVSKLIPNSLLITEGPNQGTNIIAEMNDMMSKVIEYLDDTTIENFIRSNPNLRFINTRRVTKTGNMYELNKRKSDIVILRAKDTELLEKYGIKTIGSNNINSYVRLKFGNNTILYRINNVDNAGFIILTPLNKLERNENANQSANEMFNTYPVRTQEGDYFEGLIRQYTENIANNITGPSINEFEKLIDDTTLNRFKAISYSIAKDNIVKDFIVEKDSELGRKLLDTATEIVNDSEKPYRYIVNIPISKYIEKGESMFITIPIKTKNGDKIDYSNPRSIFEIRRVDISKIYGKLHSTETEREKLSEEQKDMLSVLDKLEYMHISKGFSSLFEVREYNKNLNDNEVKSIKFSTIGHKAKPIVDATMSTIQGINYMAYSTGEKEVTKLSKEFKQRGIVRKEVVAEAHIDEVIIPAAKAIEHAVEEIKNNFNSFWEIPDRPHEYYKITDPEVVKEIKVNPALREKYLKAIMDPGAIESKFAMFKDLDIEAEDEHLRPYLKKIKDSINSLRNIPEVKKAQENYVFEVLNKLSDNPYIKSGMISVIDGFYKQSTLNALFNDIQESPNSVVQVTMKMIQSNLRASEMQTKRDIENFISHVEDIKSRARAAGLNIDYNNIFDEYGRFVRQYKEKLNEDRYKLQKSADDAKLHWIEVRDSKPNNELSEESILAYLDFQKATLTYNKWKAKYIEQEADNEYYNQKNLLAETILTSRAKYIFAVYNILRDKRSRLQARQIEDIDNPDLDNEIDKVITDMYNLRQTFIYNEVTRDFSDKRSFTENDDSELINNYTNDAKSSQLLDDWVKYNYSNETKYFKYEEKPEFQQRVKDYEAIIRKYEKPDSNGLPTVSQDILADNEEYQKAKRWLRRNGRSLFVERGDDSWLLEYSQAVLDLKQDSESQGLAYHNVTVSPKYRDENGDIDGTKVDLNIINKIRKEQQRIYKVYNEADLSDRSLISMAPVDDLVYTNTYWEEMLGVKRGESEFTDEYKTTITIINNILSPYYIESTNSINWNALFEDYKDNEEELIKILETLNLAYDAINDIKKHKNKTYTNSGKQISEFIKNNCVISINTAAYNNDLIFLSTLKGRKQELFRQLIQSHSKDDTEGNSSLYKTYKLKYTDENSKEYKKYINIKKTNARRVINKYTYKVNTKYYYIAAKEASDKGQYKEWFKANHVYNPYERIYEPISIWRKTEFRRGINSEIEVKWVPNYGQTVRKVRDGYLTLSDINNSEFNSSSNTSIKKYISDEELVLTENYFEEFDTRNKKYKEGFGHAENYKYGTNSEYDNPNRMNEYEKEMSDYMQTIMTKLVEDEATQHYIKRGWAPTRLKSETSWKEELKKIAGFSYYHNGRDEESPVIDYAHDKFTKTPMLSLIKHSTQPNKLKKPIREECLDEEEYMKKKLAWDAEEERVKKEELELHKMYHDNDYEGIFKQFIAKANHYNTIQHNKMNFYMAQKLLSEYGVYRQRFGKEGDFKKDGTMSDSEQAEYLKQIDHDMLDQFTTTIRRFVNNEWKSPEGSLTRYMSMLQAMTSAKFMIFNHKGGIANVTYGEASIHSESQAREYFNEKDSIAGLRIYTSGLVDYAAHMYNDKSSTLAGAIIKFMNIVDYDEQNGLNFLNDNLAELSKRVNDLAYSAQSAGEHAMQNRVMFAMMTSHRLFENPRSSEFGQPKYKFMNYKEYIEGIEESALMDILTDKEKEEYNKYKEKMSSDANKLKSYIWLRDDFVTNYVNARFDWTRQSQFNKIKKNRLKDAKKEFNDDKLHPTIFSQLKLGSNGKLAFREGTLLYEMGSMRSGKNIENNNNLNSPSDALKFLADFKGRVISVNKKIHGSYDKSGRAKVENSWWGGIVMQYHKHLPIGFAKRYRSKGYFNEERGTREKGAYTSIIDFLSIPVKRNQTILDLSDEEVETTVAIQNIVKDYLSFAFNIRTAYNTMPEYDKANVRRACADFQAMFSALFACIALKMAATDDDKNRWWYNFAFYQTDRLASESSQYMPWVLPQEAKKFFGNPIAGFKEVDDLLSTVSALTQMLMGTVGLSDFESTYETGPNAGRNKLLVYIERNIPFWRGIRSAYIDINDNNKAYKAGKNVLGFIDTDKAAEKGKELFD